MKHLPIMPEPYCRSRGTNSVAANVNQAKISAGDHVRGIPRLPASYMYPVNMLLNVTDAKNVKNTHLGFKATSGTQSTIAITQNTATNVAIGLNIGNQRVGLQVKNPEFQLFSSNFHFFFALSSGRQRPP
jgi:hypothetical protein